MTQTLETITSLIQSKKRQATELADEIKKIEEVRELIEEKTEELALHEERIKDHQQRVEEIEKEIQEIMVDSCLF